jgi:cytochrome c oxidase subunit 3
VQSTTASDPAVRERDLNSLSILTAVVVLATVTMTFGAMIAVFLVRSLAPKYWGHLHVPGILWATTCILLASSVTFELARRRLQTNDQAGFFRLICWTTGLGVIFLLGQITAWFQVLHSGIVLANNPHSWFVFLFSGLHGLHILLGLGGLAYLLVRTREPASGPKYQMKTRVVAKGVSVFWHYLDFLWMLMFVLLLVWRR